MSHSAEITYLNSIKQQNSDKIASNTATIDAYSSAIESLNAQIESYQQLQNDLNAANASLVADNQLVDDIIAELGGI